VTYTKTLPVYIAHDDDRPAQTVLVTGQGRGGTTVLREIATGLGVQMTEGVSHFTVDLHEIPEYYGDVRYMRSITEDRARHNVLWGWKDIFLLSYLEDLIDLIPSPRMLIAIRDPLATAMRAVADGPDSYVLDVMDKLNAGARRLIKFARSGNMPVALVSYEKLCAYPEEGVEQIAGFLRLAPTREAVACIRPGRGYTQDLER
jgi:hypothetical protein